MFQCNYYYGNTNLISIHVLLLLETFWDPKSVHSYLMYLKHDSIIGLMMTLWVETRRHIHNWQ